MSYESLCEEMYQKRLAEKQERENKRAAFRQKVLDRQNGVRGVQTETAVKNQEFVMPEVLPTSVDALKELIRLNMLCAHEHPEREKECRQNIRAIRNCLNVS